MGASGRMNMSEKNVGIIIILIEKNVIYNKIMSAKMLFSNGNMP